MRSNEEIPLGMTYAVVEDPQPGGWSDYLVEAIDNVGDGRIFSTLFYGSCAKERAEHYAAMMNGAKVGT